MDPVVAHLEWLRLRGLSEGTIGGRRRALARMTVMLPCPLLEATPSDLLAWRAGLRGLGPSATLNYVTHAHQFYGWAVARGLISANPAAGLPVPRRPRRLPRPIDEAELMAALAAAPPRVRPWLVLAGWAGLRAKEIAGLRRENVLTEGPAHLLRVVTESTKGIDERLVPLCSFALGELVPVLPHRGWVFLRADRSGPVSPWVVSHVACQHLHACGSAATLHQLRHRFGTQAYRRSLDLRAVQEMLGHRDPATTAGYAAYEQGAAAAALEDLPVPGC